jgi:hypothetical protein
MEWFKPCNTLSHSAAGRLEFKADLNAEGSLLNVKKILSWIENPIAREQINGGVLNFV